VLAALQVSTPLGPVVVSIEVDTSDEPLHERRAELPSGAVLARWWTDSRLEVRALLVRYDEAWNAHQHFTASGCWGVVWSVLTERTTSPVLVRAATPLGHVAIPNTGECLEATEVESSSWIVTVGGPDDELLAARVGCGLPASWAGKVGWRFDLPVAAQGRYTATAGADGVTWVLPPLEPRERATTHVAIAWALTGADDDGVTGWYAVDTCPGDLLEHAGVGPTRPHRHGWPHVPRLAVGGPSSP